MLAKLSLILLLFFTAAFSIRTDFSFDQDLGRHLKLGEIIVSSREVPKTNLFSYTFPNFPFINHHFLFEILIFLGQQVVGLQGFMIVLVKKFVLYWNLDENQASCHLPYHCWFPSLFQQPF